MAEFNNFWLISICISQMTKVAKTNSSAMASATATSIANFWKIKFFGQILVLWPSNDKIIIIYLSICILGIQNSTQMEKNSNFSAFTSFSFAMSIFVKRSNSRRVCFC